MIDIKDFHPWDASYLDLRTEIDGFCLEKDHVQDLWERSHIARTFSSEGKILFCTGLVKLADIECIWMLVDQSIKKFPHKFALLKAIKQEIAQAQTRSILALVDEGFEEGRKFASFFGFKYSGHKETIANKERLVYIKPLTEAHLAI